MKGRQEGIFPPPPPAPLFRLAQVFDAVMKSDGCHARGGQCVRGYGPGLLTTMGERESVWFAGTPTYFRNV